MIQATTQIMGMMMKTTTKVETKFHPTKEMKDEENITVANLFCNPYRRVCPRGGYGII